MWVDEISGYKKSTLQTLRENVFDVHNDRSFSTQGLCTRLYPSKDLRQFQNDLYIKQSLSFICRRSWKLVKHKAQQRQCKVGNRWIGNLNIQCDHRRNEERTIEREIFMIEIHLQQRRSIQSTSRCSCCTVVSIQGFFSQTVHEAGILSMSYDMSYSNHAQNCPTVMSHVSRHWTWIYIHVVQGNSFPVMFWSVILLQSTGIQLYKVVKERCHIFGRRFKQSDNVW